MKIKMELLSDVIFGNGKSIPGAEDISVLCDEYGFPYYKAGTFKGIFREELVNYLDNIKGCTEQERSIVVNELLGLMGANDNGSLIFSDFTLSYSVKKAVIDEIGQRPEMIKDSMTNLRTFTALEDGMIKNGSLRYARCVNKGLIFYSEISCDKKDEALVNTVLGMIKSIGSMRKRGFGNVKISAKGE